MFTSQYLERCHADKPMWQGKQPSVGDWYIDWDSDTLDVLALDALDRVDFNSSRYTYVPSTDDLLELVDNQVRAWGDDPERKKLKITFDQEKKWCMEIRYAGRITSARTQNTIEELLYMALRQMIYVDPTPVLRGKTR